MNRAVRLWPSKCPEATNLHGFLFVEFNTSSSGICHMFRECGLFSLISIYKKCFKAFSIRSGGTRSEIHVLREKV